MKYLAYVLTWSLFWIGHGVSGVMNVPLFEWVYPLYNKLMIASIDVQDKYKVENGPWK